MQYFLTQHVRACHPAGSAKWQARAYVLGCAVLACLTTWLAVQISYAQKHFSTGLAEKDQGALLLEPPASGVLQLLQLLCCGLAVRGAWLQGLCSPSSGSGCQCLHFLVQYGVSRATHRPRKHLVAEVALRNSLSMYPTLPHCCRRLSPYLPCTCRCHNALLCLALPCL